MATETNPAAGAYLELMRAFPPRPIRSDDDHDRAIAAINALADRRDGWGADEEDYFLVLALLIERYEEEIYPSGPEPAASEARGCEPGGPSLV